MGGVQQFTLRSGAPEAEVALGDAGGVVTAAGGTVFYRDEPGVSSSSNDGSIAAGSSATLYGTQFFSTTASRADVTVVTLTTTPGGGVQADIRDFGASTTSSDNLAALQAAVAALVSTGSGRKILRIPPGTWITSPWTLTSEIEVVGDGVRLSVLKLKNGANADLVTIPWDTFLVLPKFRRVAFDGNKANNTAGSSVVLPANTTGSYGGAVDFFECDFRNAKEDGLKVGTARNNGKVSTCYFGPNDARGIAIDGTDWTITNTQVGDSGTIGIHGTSGANALTIDGGGMFRSGTYNVKIDDAHYAWLRGVSIDGGQQVGLHLGAIGSTTPRQHIVMGCQFLNNSVLATGTYSAIVLAQVDRPVIIGNSFFHFVGNGIPKYLVECVTAPTNIVFQGNTFNTNDYATAITNDTSKFAVYDVPGQTHKLIGTSGFVENYLRSGEATARFSLDTTGKINWSHDGATQTVNLYTNAQDLLKTDDQFAAADGIRTKDLGDISAKTTAQIDALFTRAPADGTIATAIDGVNPVLLLRRASKWHKSATYTQIA